MFIVSFNLPVVCSLYAFNEINSLRFARDRVTQLIITNDKAMKALAALIAFFLYVFQRLRIKISKSTSLKNTKTVKSIMTNLIHASIDRSREL